MKFGLFYLFRTCRSTTSTRRATSTAASWGSWRSSARTSGARDCGSAAGPTSCTSRSSPVSAEADRDESAATDRPDRAGGHVAFTMSGSLDEITRCLEAERIPYARGRAGLPQIFCEDPAGNLVELNTGWTQQLLG